MKRAGTIFGVIAASARRRDLKWLHDHTDSPYVNSEMRRFVLSLQRKRRKLRRR